jgi:hypothetical protein
MSTILDDFLGWECTVRDDVNHIKSILSYNLSDEPEILIKDLEDAEVWGARTGFILAEANSWLDKARNYYRPDKEGGKTESDRKVILDNAVTDIRKFRDFVEALTDSIKQRLYLGGQILSYLRSIKPPMEVQNPPQQSKKTNLGVAPW